MLNRLNIGKRLTAAFLLAALITLLSGLAGIHFTSRVGNAGIEIGENDGPLIDAVMESKLQATMAHLKFEEIMGGDTAESIDAVRALMQDARWFIVVIAEGGSNEEGTFVALTDPDALAIQARSLAYFDALAAALDQRYASRGETLSEARFHELDAQFDAAFDAFINEIDSLESIIQTRAATSLKGLRDTVDSSRWIMIAIVVAALVTGVLLGQVITASITRPLGACVTLASRIERGDLTASATPTGSDEIAHLQSTLERMRAGLDTMIRGIRDGINTLNGATTALTQSAEQSEKASTEQSDAASGMAAAVEQLSVSIDHIGTLAHDANESARASATELNASGQVIHESADDMTEVARAVNEAAGTIQSLEDFSSQISSVINVIKDIADQTNLLALNAAIEAARAGEQGRGFAVVADEVRKLAERTSNSTQEIADTIAKIQSGTQRAVTEMADGVARVNTGVELAHRAGESVRGIRASAEQVGDAVSDITRTLAEQSSTTHEIATRLERIASAAEANRDLVGNTATSSRTLAGMAVQLEAMVARFQVG